MRRLDQVVEVACAAPSNMLSVFTYHKEVLQVTQVSVSLVSRVNNPAFLLTYQRTRTAKDLAARPGKFASVRFFLWDGLDAPVI